MGADDASKAWLHRVHVERMRGFRQHFLHLGAQLLGTLRRSVRNNQSFPQGMQKGAPVIVVGIA